MWSKVENGGDTVFVDTTTPLNCSLPATVYDAFGRNRVSNPTTLFDSKQIFDNAPLFFDDSEVSGSGTTSSHSTDTACTTMGVGATTAGKRVRQTFQRFNYQPGKSQLILVTGNLRSSGGGTGITTAMGYFDDNNGFFYKIDEGTPKIVKRSYISGSAVDTEITQTSWNGDTVDGNGSSGYTLDPTKSIIFWVDMEWLGVGSVRAGFVIDGKFILAHTFHHSNTIDTVYISTPNLPIRYEIENDGTGAASEMEHICCSVMSEGGVEELGTVRGASTAGTHVDANTADSLYAIVGIRLKSTHLAETVKIEQISLLAETNDDFEWQLLFNPTVAGTFTYGNETNSAIQSATGDSTNTVTNGTIIGTGFVDANSPIVVNPSNALRLGASIAGTPDEIVLCARPLSANADIQGSITWREAT